MSWFAVILTEMEIIAGWDLEFSEAGSYQHHKCLALRLTNSQVRLGLDLRFVFNINSRKSIKIIDTPPFMGIHSQKCLRVTCRCLMSGWDTVCLHETVDSDVLRVHELKDPQSKQVTSEPTSFYY